MKLKNILESVMQPHLNPLEDAIKAKLSSLGDVYASAAENDANERVFGSVTFREDMLPDLNKIEALLKQVKGPNGEDLDIQITPGQINYEYEREYDNDRSYWPKFKFTSIKGIYVKN
jgi:hypothetical protein